MTSWSCVSCGGWVKRQGLCASCANPEPRYREWLDQTGRPDNTGNYQAWFRERWVPWENTRRQTPTRADSYSSRTIVH